MVRMAASAASWRVGRAMVDRDGLHGRVACASRDGDTVEKPSSPVHAAPSYDIALPCHTLL